MALAAPSSAAERPWYLPDHAKLQFAGSIGFLSPGVGWGTARRTLELDVLAGWVPRAIAGEDIYSVTGKLVLQPLRWTPAPRWLVRPLSGALQVTYTFGREYFVRPPPQFRPDYYDVPSALRAGLAFGGSVAFLTGGVVRELGLYWEAVALDVMLFEWARNPRTLGPEDVFTLALGLRLGF